LFEKKLIPVLSILLFILACTDLVSKNTLYGYDRGKKTFKLETSLNLQKYAGEKTGYRYEETNYWGVGNKNSRKTVRKSWLNSDYSLRRSEKEEMINGKSIKTMISTSENEITIEKFQDTRKVLEKSIKSDQPVFVEILPEMYVRDLKAKGDEKVYTVLNDRKANLANLKVRCLGEQSLTVNEESRVVIHYQLQVISSPGEYDNYYIDPDTCEILQISFGDIRFVPE